MKTHAVVSALGRDRVGVADDLAEALAKRHVEIEDSRMTALGGQFALIAHVCGESDNVTSLRFDLDTLASSLGFHLQLDSIDPTRSPKKAPSFLIETFSPGPPGIGAVTAVLKKHDLNIEELETETYQPHWSSATAFHMKARVNVSPTFPVSKLREELRAIERQKDLDIVIKPLPSVVVE